MFDRVAYQKKYYVTNRKKARVVNLVAYSAWKENSVAYKQINCDRCHQSKEAIAFYIGHLRFRMALKSTRNCFKGRFIPLCCKACITIKVVKEVPTKYSDFKVKSPEITPEMQKYFNEQKLKRVKRVEIDLAHINKQEADNAERQRGLFNNEGMGTQESLRIGQGPLRNSRMPIVEAAGVRLFCAPEELETDSMYRPCVQDTISMGRCKGDS